jgi:hypothetical protein
MQAETVSRKRFNRVFVCAACDKLSTSERSHTTTCSPACRTRLHRDPDRMRLTEAICKAYQITVASVLEARAIDILRPDLAKRVMAGELTLEQCRPEVWPTFWSLVKEARDAAT